jgi:two-component system LytT family response regulator
MKIKAVLVDDEPKSVMLLEKYLEPYSYIIQVVATAHDADSAFMVIKQNNPDLLFLDISMPGSSGLDLLNRFAKKSFEVIFTTAHKEYALEAFNQCAIHYLLKPIDLLQLDEALNRSFAKFESKAGNASRVKKKKILVYDQNGYELIDSNDIIRCEAQGAYTEIFLNNDTKITSSQNLKTFELQLQTFNFLRIHKSHLINLDEVKSFTRGKSGYVTLKDSTNIFMSLQKKNEFFQRLKEHYINEKP